MRNASKTLRINIQTWIKSDRFSLQTWSSWMRLLELKLHFQAKLLKILIIDYLHWSIILFNNTQIQKKFIKDWLKTWLKSKTFERWFLTTLKDNNKTLQKHSFWNSLKRMKTKRWKQKRMLNQHLEIALDVHFHSLVYYLISSIKLHRSNSLTLFIFKNNLWTHFTCKI